MSHLRGFAVLVQSIVIAVVLMGCAGKKHTPRGRTLRFSYVHSAGGNEPKIAEALQASWREVLGAEVTLVPMQAKDKYAAALQPHDFEAGFAGWGGDYNDAYTFLSLMRSHSPYNYPDWSSPEYDRLTEEGFRTLDPRAAHEAYRRAERLLLDSGTVVPITMASAVMLVKPYVEGIHPNVIDTHPLRHVRINSAWRGNGNAYFGTERVPDESVFRMCVGPAPQTIDPQGQQESWGVSFTDAAFEGLVNMHPRTGAEDPATGAPLPGLAERWESTPDKKTWTFHLRHDSYWVRSVFDGRHRVVRVEKLRPVTAHDIVYAWKDHCLGAASTCKYMQLFDEIQYDSVEAVDDFTLVVRLKNPSAIFLQMMGFATFLPVHPETVRRHGEAWVAPEHIISNGPYVLESWGSTEIRMRRNPHYWWWATQPDAARAPETIIATVTDNFQSMQDAYEQGDLEWMAIACRPTNEMVAAHQRTARDLSIVGGMRTFWVALNPHRGPFRDPRVGQALAWAVNREGIIEALQLPDLPFGRYVPENIGGYRFGEPGFTYDPDRARRLLREAGYAVPGTGN